MRGRSTDGLQAFDQPDETASRAVSVLDVLNELARILADRGRVRATVMNRFGPVQPPYLRVGTHGDGENVLVVGSGGERWFGWSFGSPIGPVADIAAVADAIEIFWTAR